MTSPGRGSGPRRVKVTSPRRTAHAAGHRSRYRDLEEQTLLGEVYVESILRAQRRLAGSLVSGIVLLVVGLPLALLVLPEIFDLGLFTVPASWVALGVLVYPFALLVTSWYVRAAERVEREFAELMDLP